MGLKFCNEAIIALQQIWPKAETSKQFDLSPLQVNENRHSIWKSISDSFIIKPCFQEALIERLGKNSVPFVIEIGSITPPSVQLLPAKRYTGAPIGTSYDIRVYTGKRDSALKIKRFCYRRWIVSQCRQSQQQLSRLMREYKDDQP